MSRQRALIFANGSLPNREAAGHLVSSGDILIGADGGTQHLLSLDLLPDIVVGDLDSLELPVQKKLKVHGTKFKIYPPEKDETDLELAIQYAVEQGYDPIVIVAALGDRLDHTIGNLSLITDPVLSGRDIRLDDGTVAAFIVRDQVQLVGSLGDLVSLLPWGGPVTGIETSGLKYPLSGETLSPHKTRGISNELVDKNAAIKINSGMLLVIHIRKRVNHVASM